MHQHLHANDGTETPTVQDLVSYRLPSGFRGRSAVYTQLWWIVQATLFGLSPAFMFGWRRFLVRLFGAKVGEGVRMRPSVRIYFPWKVDLRDHCQLGERAELYSLGPITIGEMATVSQDAYICTGSHDIYSPTFDIYTQPIVIEREAWVCAGAFVFPGVTVGRGAVIGARSLLKQDAEPYGLYAGSPARKVGDRRQKLRRG
jgi:putative colanic acid biosynthesis acetyltransferase WcaF